MTYQAPAYDQGQSRRTFLLILLVVLAFFSLWAWVFFHQKPRVSDGTIESLTVIPRHTEIRQGGTMREGYGGGIAKSDDLYVWVAFNMKNLTEDVPLYETGQQATLSLADGRQLFAHAADTRQVAMVQALPKIQQVQGALVPREMTLKPGESTRGLALFAFPVTQQVWDQRRQFSVDVAFQFQRDLAMKELRPLH